MWPHRRQPPGSPIPGILQARTLEWIAISFSNAWKWEVKAKSFSHVWLFATPWTAVHQAPPSMGFSRQGYWSGVPLPSPKNYTLTKKIKFSVWFLVQFPWLPWPFDSYLLIQYLWARSGLLCLKYTQTVSLTDTTEWQQCPSGLALALLGMLLSQSRLLWGCWAWAGGSCRKMFRGRPWHWAGALCVYS